jgi:hypothetical protein
LAICSSTGPETCALVVVFPIAAPNLEPRDDIWPTETAPVFRRREDGVELVQGFE